MTPSEAAMNYLISIGVETSGLSIGMVQQFEWGWTVHVNSLEYWKTRDLMDMLIGLSPVFVSQQLHCKLFPTGMSFEEMCTEFANEAAD